MHTQAITTKTSAQTDTASLEQKEKEEKTLSSSFYYNPDAQLPTIIPERVQQFWRQAVAQSNQSAINEWLKKYPTLEENTPNNLFSTLVNKIKLSADSITKEIPTAKSTLHAQSFQLIQKILDSHLSREQKQPARLLDLYLTLDGLLGCLRENTEETTLRTAFKNFLAKRENLLRGDGHDYCYSRSLANFLCCKLVELAFPNELSHNLLLAQAITAGRKQPWWDVIENSNELPVNPDTFFRTADNRIHLYEPIVDRAISELKSGLWKTGDVWIGTDILSDEKGAPSLSAEDVAVLEKRTPVLADLVNYQQQLQDHFDGKSQHIFERFCRLRKGLQKGDISRRGGGTEYNAGDQALVAIAEFADWWNTLSTTVQMELKSIPIPNNNYTDIYPFRSLKDVISTLLDPNKRIQRGKNDDARYCVYILGSLIQAVLDTPASRQKMMDLSKSVDIRLSNKDLDHWQALIKQELQKISADRKMRPSWFDRLSQNSTLSQILAEEEACGFNDNLLDYTVAYELTHESTSTQPLNILTTTDMAVLKRLYFRSQITDRCLIQHRLAELSNSSSTQAIAVEMLNVALKNASPQDLEKLSPLFTTEQKVQMLHISVMTSQSNLMTMLLKQGVQPKEETIDLALKNLNLYFFALTPVSGETLAHLQIRLIEEAPLYKNQSKSLEKTLPKSLWDYVRYAGFDGFAWDILELNDISILKGIYLCSTLRHVHDATRHLITIRLAELSAQSSADEATIKQHFNDFDRTEQLDSIPLNSLEWISQQYLTNHHQQKPNAWIKMLSDDRKNEFYAYLLLQQQKAEQEAAVSKYHTDYNKKQRDQLFQCLRDHKASISDSAIRFALSQNSSIFFSKMISDFASLMDLVNKVFVASPNTTDQKTALNALPISFWIEKAIAVTNNGKDKPADVLNFIFYRLTPAAFFTAVSQTEWAKLVKIFEPQHITDFIKHFEAQAQSLAPETTSHLTTAMKDGSTLLHLAIRYNQTDLANRLIANDAVSLVRDHQNENPIDIACALNHFSILAALTEWAKKNKKLEVQYITKLITLAIQFDQEKLALELIPLIAASDDQSKERCLRVYMVEALLKNNKAIMTALFEAGYKDNSDKKYVYVCESTEEPLDSFYSTRHTNEALYKINHKLPLIVVASSMKAVNVESLRWLLSVATQYKLDVCAPKDGISRWHQKDGIFSISHYRELIQRSISPSLVCASGDTPDNQYEKLKLLFAIPEILEPATQNDLAQLLTKPAIQRDATMAAKVELEWYAKSVLTYSKPPSVAESKKELRTTYHNFNGDQLRSIRELLINATFKHQPDKDTAIIAILSRMEMIITQHSPYKHHTETLRPYSIFLWDEKISSQLFTDIIKHFLVAHKKSEKENENQEYRYFLSSVMRIILDGQRNDLLEFWIKTFSSDDTAIALKDAKPDSYNEKNALHPITVALKNNNAAFQEAIRKLMQHAKESKTTLYADLHKWFLTNGIYNYYNEFNQSPLGYIFTAPGATLQQANWVLDRCEGQMDFQLHNSSGDKQAWWELAKQLNKPLTERPSNKVDIFKELLRRFDLNIGKNLDCALLSLEYMIQDDAIPVAKMQTLFAQLETQPDSEKCNLSDLIQLAAKAEKIDKLKILLSAKGLTSLPENPKHDNAAIEKIFKLAEAACVLKQHRNAKSTDLKNTEKLPTGLFMTQVQKKNLEMKLTVTCEQLSVIIKAIQQDDLQRVQTAITECRSKINDVKILRAFDTIERILNLPQQQCASSSSIVDFKK
jgi:hypothetical protein